MNGLEKWKETLRIKIGMAHLLYLGILPTLATIGALALDDRKPSDNRMFFLFLAGVGAVGVYLAFIGSYTALPDSLWKTLLLWLDSPIFAFIAISGSERTNLFFWAIDSFLIDGITIFVPIMVLAWFSSAPTRDQRIASIGIMLFCLGFCAVLFYPYWQNELWGNWWRLLWLGTGIIEASVVNYKILSLDETQQDLDFSTIYIAVLLMIWVAALFVGYIPQVGAWVRTF